MTQKATHDPMHIRKLSTSTSPFTQIGKKKTHILALQKKKILGFQGECFISSIG
jgi:hypothetical protein